MDRHTDTRVTHSQPRLPALKKKKKAWSVNPWLSTPRLGSPGPVGKGMLRPWAPAATSTGQLSLRAACSARAPGPGSLGRRPVWAEGGPAWLEVKSPHSAPENRRRKASGRGLSPRQEHSSKASWALVSFNGNLQRVLLCREVWKRLSPLPRDLAALPDFFLHSPHPLIDSPK